jgi:predicted tellurium resistance membrane protein TerC
MLDLFISFFTLTIMELVLGIDNIIFISLVTENMQQEERKRGRRVGLTLALVLRIILLMSINWLIHFDDALFTLFNHSFSGRDLILLSGGIFLIYKTTIEIHEKVEKDEHSHKTKAKALSFAGAVFQIAMLDLVFSFDSILTAVGLVKNVEVMIAAVVASMILMMLFSGQIANFVNKHPTIKVLALSFLMLIGVLLVAEAFHVHVEKAYVYFAMAFSFGVELLNMRMRKKKSTD